MIKRNKKIRLLFSGNFRAQSLLRMVVCNFQIGTFRFEFSSELSIFVILFFWVNTSKYITKRYQYIILPDGFKQPISVHDIPFTSQ